jgi:hypothetical protein
LFVSVYTTTHSTTNFIFLTSPVSTAEALHNKVIANLQRLDTEGLSAGLYFVHLIYANSKTLCVPWVKI